MKTEIPRLMCPICNAYHRKGCPERKKRIDAIDDYTFYDSDLTRVGFGDRPSFGGRLYTGFAMLSDEFED